jgi:hypothetical protein
VKKLLLAPLFAVVLSLSGCASLFPGLTTGNPVADVTAFIQVAQFTDALVVDAWPIAYAMVPPANQGAALAAYEKAQGVYAASIQVAQDAVAAYIAGTGAPPNWTVVIASVQDAIDAIVVVVRSFGGTVGSPSVRFRLSSPALVDRLASIEASQATVHRFHAP